MTGQRRARSCRYPVIDNLQFARFEIFQRAVNTPRVELFERRFDMFLRPGHGVWLTVQEKLCVAEMGIRSAVAGSL
jgi:hypothetical protein